MLALALRGEIINSDLPGCERLRRGVKIFRSLGKQGGRREGQWLPQDRYTPHFNPVWLRRLLSLFQARARACSGWRRVPCAWSGCRGNISAKRVRTGPQHRFDIDIALARIEKAAASWPKAALFQLYDEGYQSPFLLLVACMISVRTRDEVTVVCARRLFALARRPYEMAGLGVATIDAAIRPCTFHAAKAAQIRAIANEVATNHGGEIACDFALLTGFRGVGPKCANLVLGIACARPSIGVDIHVHRVTNRWGYVRTSSPQRTMIELEAKLPVRYWVDINRLLVAFGKRVCTGGRPRCSCCPLRDMCPSIGVGEHR